MKLSRYGLIGTMPGVQKFPVRRRQTNSYLRRGVLEKVGTVGVLE